MSGYLPIRMFIDGEWVARSGEDVLNPSDETVLGQVPHATAADLDVALAAAARGFGTWRDMAPEARHEIITRAIALLRERADQVAAIISLEQGKPHAQARAEVLRGADLMIWDAEEGRRAYGRVIPSAAGWRNFVTKEPIGPVAAFTPWSAPTSAPGRKIGGALAAGCSIVLKASEETPGGAVQLVRCFEKAGLPAGVVNLVFGVPSKISEHLIAAPETRLVTFTGSVPVGIHLAGLAAKKLKPVIMELGGHSPVFVGADADPITTARLAAAAKFRNAGQVCISPTRFFVHEAVHDAFVAEFAKAAAAVRLGGTGEADSQMGPLANARRVGAMREMVDDAVSRGAKLAAGGKSPDRPGYFFEPTVLTDIPLDALVMRSEPFGPIAAVRSWTDLDEAIEAANALEYGLAAYAFSDSAATLDRIASRLEVGHLSINHFGGGVPESPFGGVKYSGIGREGGQEGLEGYFVTKYVSHRMRA
jgi:succinate-semialdehyde dehydrogenase / glutarate-semialdehyde dehydrogenase